MKKQVLAIAFIATFLTPSLLRADEGMWLPFLLARNYEDMKKMGLNLTAKEIYSINNSSIKDAIVSFGGFCTAEVISKKGLLLTNHHCGYDAIASSSTTENNYLEDGFWALNHKMEIPIPGLTATFVISIDDVTEQIVKNLTDEMSEEERNAKIREISKTLTDEATEGTGYKAYVRDFFEGNEFYIFVTNTYEDVRLAGTPPESIGKFGHDTDNWMYPRHTGDFSMFRIYAGADNNPAAYSPENKPYSPKHALPVSIKGIQEGDFTMVFGFPGSTDRYLSSFGIEQAISKEQPKRVEIRRKKLDIMKKYMDADKEVRLKYASKHAQVANYWKYFIGQTEQLKNNNVAEKKREIERHLNDFATNNPRYASVFGNIEAAYKVKDEYVYTNVYQSEFIYTVDLNVNIFRFSFMEQAFERNGEEGMNGVLNILKGLMEEFYTNANLDIEFETLTEVLKMYAHDVPQHLQPELVKQLAAKNGIDKYVAKARKKSIFASAEKLNAFAAKPSLKKLKKDPLYALIKSISDKHTEANNVPAHKEAKEKLTVANRLFVEGYRLMEPTKQFYPNANSTLRLTYGRVLPYSPSSTKKFEYYTSLEGVFEKEDPNNPEFHVSEKLRELYKAKNFGKYANEKGEMPVNFISNNDITGGNSGSPVLNADGHLIGTAFDGNWEAMSGDIFFERDIQRTISCDIRYVLFIIEKLGGAKNLIDEMELVK
ncbi:MAG: S46 family peptidase [Crocinitomicaceae bacterium]|nr:S46 family peptidase [Crocinitomicaceae bacterium]